MQTVGRLYKVTPSDREPITKDKPKDTSEVKKAPDIDDSVTKSKRAKDNKVKA